MIEIIEHVDNERIVEDGHSVRFILPANARPGRVVDRGVCTDRLFDGRKVRTFTIVKGDVSANEALQYAGRLAASPARAMASFDVSRTDTHPPGSQMHASFIINIRPGHVMTHDWCGICQWNNSPRKGERWRNPPFSIQARPRVPHARDEVFVGALATFPTAGSSEQGRAVPLFEAPLQRDRPYRFDISFTDGAGAAGHCKVTLDGAVLCDYAGPTGFANYNGCYWAYGLYRSPWCPGGEMLSASFEHVVEGPG